jgi:hypothetical protein
MLRCEIVVGREYACACKEVGASVHVSGAKGNVVVRQPGVAESRASLSY